LPVLSIKRLSLLNHRNHRKLVIVDGEVAFTGGLNLGEEYVGKNPDKHYWRDTHLVLNGESVKKLEAIFIADWNFSTGEILHFPSVRQSQNMMEESKFHAIFRGSKQEVLTIPSGPHATSNVSLLLFLQIIHGAKKRIWISTPYFVPDDSLQRGLELAILKGVDVKILIPWKSKQKLVHWVSLSFGEQVHKIGASVYLYEKGFVHQKIILVDDKMTFIGTCNFDNRALHCNFELTLGIIGLEFNRKVDEMLCEDFSNAKIFANEEKRFTKKLNRLRANSARLLAPLL
jgi:cardiolipin synthase